MIILYPIATDGTTLFIKNKKGKVLWTKRIDLDGVEISRY